MLEELLAKILGGGGGFVPPNRQPGDALSPAELGVPQGGLMSLLGGGGQPQQQAQPQPQQTQEMSAQSRQAPPMAAPSGGGINFGDLLGRLGPALMMMSGDPNYIRAGGVMSAQQGKNRQTAQEQQQANAKITATYQWLVGNGMNPQQAAITAQDPAALREYLKPKEPAKPTYGVIGHDQFDRPQYGWIDSSKQSTTPSAPLQNGQQPGESAIPAPPPGVDPKKWREEQTKRLMDKDAAPDDKSVVDLRKEITSLPSYKNVAQAAPIYNSMRDAAGRDTRASDVNMIYGMAKIMDPTSVVREGEMTIAQAIATFPQYMQAQIKSQMDSTGRLSPDVRAAIMQEAHGRMRSYQGMFDQDMKMYGGIADRRKMSRDDVIPTFGPFEPYQQQAPQAPTGPAKINSKADYDKLPSGAQFIAPDGSTRVKP
jgi:hypothetical protein